jgi:hypothetical protein
LLLTIFFLPLLQTQMKILFKQQYSIFEEIIRPVVVFRRPREYLRRRKCRECECDERDADHVFGPCVYNTSSRALGNGNDRRIHRHGIGGIVMTPPPLESMSAPPFSFPPPVRPNYWGEYCCLLCIMNFNEASCNLMTGG